MNIEQINASLNENLTRVRFGPYSREVETALADLRAARVEHVAEIAEIDHRLETLHADDVRGRLQTRFAFGIAFDHHGKWLGFGRYQAYVETRTIDHPWAFILSPLFTNTRTYAWKSLPTDEQIVRDTDYRETLRASFPRCGLMT